jgi:hypothetical protein
MGGIVVHFAKDHDLRPLQHRREHHRGGPNSLGGSKGRRGDETTQKRRRRGAQDRTKQPQRCPGVSRKRDLRDRPARIGRRNKRPTPPVPRCRTAPPTGPPMGNCARRLAQNRRAIIARGAWRIRWRGMTAPPWTAPRASCASWRRRRPPAGARVPWTGQARCRGFPASGASSRSLRSRTMKRSRSFRAPIALISHSRSVSMSWACSTASAACSLSSSSVSIHSRPSSSTDCVALSEKSDPASRPSIISTSWSGTPTSVAIIWRSWCLSSVSPSPSPHAPAGPARGAC